MSVPEKCGHGIQLRGKDAPRCIECDIVWHTMQMQSAEEKASLHRKALVILRDAIAIRSITFPEDQGGAAAPS